MFKKIIPLIIAFICTSLLIANTKADVKPSTSLYQNQTYKALENAPISVSDFRKKFNNNQNLQKIDLDIFPIELQNYLWGRYDWNTGHISGESRHLSGRFFLIWATRDSLGNNSKAAIVSFRRTKSHVRPVTWEKLYLPYLKFNKDGEIVSVSDNHANLQWNEDQRILQSTSCGDVGPIINCIKHNYKIHPSENTLLKIELRNHNTDQYEVIWEKGKTYRDKIDTILKI